MSCTCVLVHGLGGGPWVWERFQAALTAREVASVAVQLPGHTPGVAAPPRLGFGDYAAAVRTALATAERPVLIGHSMGGLIAQVLATQGSPAQAYVLLASAPPWHMLRPAYEAMWSQLFLHPNLESMGPLIGGNFQFDPAATRRLVTQRLSRKEQERVERLSLPEPGRAVRQMAFGCSGARGRAPQAPVLVVGGTADCLLPITEQRRIAARYAAPLLEFDRGHMLPLEDGVDEIAGAILRWLGDTGTCPS